MADPMHRWSDAALEDALRDLGSALAWPPSASLAEQVATIVEARPRRAGWRFALTATRPVRRSLVLALAALLLVAAIAAAVVIGVPGIRIVLLPGVGPAAPAATAPDADHPLGNGLGLGVAMPLDEAAAAVGFGPALPDGLGEPDTVWVAGSRVTLVYATAPGLPVTDAPGIGLLVTEFPGRVDEGYFEKQVHEGTTVEPVTVNGRPGWWLDGRPHFLVYVGSTGERIEESRRSVGDVLIVDGGALTVRLESSLGRDATIAIAETLIAE